MIVRTLLAALFAGILAGAAVTPLQQLKTVPLILAAETFENGDAPSLEDAAPHRHGALSLATPARAHAPVGADGEAAAMPVRAGGSFLANIVLGAGFGLLLVAASQVTGRALTGRNGVVWGLVGFAVVTLAPALGLPPELPAMPAADLGARQLWWLATVALSGAGAALLVLGRGTAMRLGGLTLLLLPHLVGAPHPASLASPVPATLAAEFAVASLAVSAALWVMIGLFAGLLLDRWAAVPDAPRPA